MRVLCLLLVCAFAVAGRDFYEVLGIERDADARQIKKAYRKLSLKWHPDRNRNSDEAKAKFAEITAAYEVLSDADKKFLFDEGGEEALEEDKKGGGMDPFSMFFGGGRKKRNANKGPDAKVQIAVTLEDLYNGKMVPKQISRLVHCKGCKQTPRTPECRKCTTKCPNEIKMVNRQMAPGFTMQQQMEVASTEKCAMEPTTLDIYLERGMAEGTTVSFKGKSERRPGQIPGDVHVVLKEHAHKQFRRDGNDLHHTMHISLREALLGFKASIPHLDDHEVLVGSSSVTKPFEVRRFKDEGMPVHNFPSQKGSLFVKFVVDFPPRLNPKQQQTIANAF